MPTEGSQFRGGPGEIVVTSWAEMPPFDSGLFVAQPVRCWLVQPAVACDRARQAPDPSQEHTSLTELSRFEAGHLSPCIFARGNRTRYCRSSARTRSTCGPPPSGRRGGRQRIMPKQWGGMGLFDAGPYLRLRACLLTLAVARPRARSGVRVLREPGPNHLKPCHEAGSLALACLEPGGNQAL